jgi:hypothetical protein
MAKTTWLDGEPRRGPDDMGGAGGTVNGRALRHSAGTEPPAQNLGRLNGTPAAKFNVEGTPYTPIFLRAGGPKTFTTGMQRGGKPKR